jgi:4-amino-4-deoxy-L-arabinose transferase-like glycosyltransferase
MADIFTEKSSYITKPSLREIARSKVRLEQSRLALVLPVIVFAAALLPRVMGLDAFITADEDDQIMFATNFLKSMLRADPGGALILGYPGVTTMFFGAIGVGLRYLAHYGGWLPLAWVQADFMTTLDQVTMQFGQFDYPMDFLVWVRAPMAIVSALGIMATYLLLRRLLDTRVALLAALVLAFDPFILAHSRLLHVDAPMAHFMFLSFLAFLIYLEAGRWKWLLLSGLLGGLALISKTPAVILGPILVVSGLLYTLLPPPGASRLSRGKNLLFALALWGLIVVAAMFALWPTMWSQPLTAVSRLIDNVQSVNRGFHPTTGIFWGNGETDKNPLYYLLVFPYHLTPLTTVGLLVGLLLIVAGAVAYVRRRDQWSARVLPLALSLVAYIVIFMTPVSVITRRGDRYILPVFFASAVLAALALWWLANWAAKTLLRRSNGSTPFYLATGVALVQVWFISAYHPYYLAYYNPLLNAAEGAPKTINVGWGEGLDQAAAYLNESQTGRPGVVAAWYSNQFAPYYRGLTIDLSSQEAALTADYTVFYINQVQRGFPSREILNYFRQRAPLHVVEVGGIEYAWIYEGPVIGQSPQSGFNTPVEAVLSGKARLYGVDLGQTEMPADTYVASPAEPDGAPYLGYKQTKTGLPITLFWETLGPLDTNHGKTNVYIRLVDDQANVWGQIDRLVLAGLWRTSSWRPGFYLRDEYILPIDPATPPGTYHLEIGLYEVDNGNSLGVVKNVGELVLTPPRALPTVDRFNLASRLDKPIDDSLILIGHTFAATELAPGAEVAGKVFWQALQVPGRDYRLEFSFLDKQRKKYIIAEQPLSAAYAPKQWRAGETVGEAYRFRIPAVALAGAYQLLLTVYDAQTGSEQGYAVLKEVQVKELHRNFVLPSEVVPISAYLNDEIELVGYKLHDLTLREKETFGLTLYWRSLDLAASNYTVFVHAVGPDQSIRGQWDSAPANGTLPTSGWIPGEVVEDHFEVLMGRDVPPWKYDIFVGMYDPLTLDRLPASSQHAPISENRIWLTRLPAVE